MSWIIPSLTTITVTLLLLAGAVSSNFANKRPRRIGQFTDIVVSFAFLISLAAAVQVAVSGPIDSSFARVTWPIPISLGLHIDSVAVVMMLLVSFIGQIIARYSLTYLRDDAGQGRFFRWMSFTIGATLLMVISRNLVMFTVAWMMTSYGLHQLLTHYPKRTWAIWAARKKFLISRLGDLMLIAALILTYQTFGTLDYVELFSKANAIHLGAIAPSVGTSWIGIFLVLGAMTKSAQFPFHSWLPDTLEAPTPVSALMQAGVINAGGFLVIRLSPLVSLSPWALDLLAVIGTLTAILGSVVMITQASIKRSLAYSTIAQMGFMILQCGLGAFSAALLHIVAHSAYKAHAYLSCGSVLDAAARTNAPVLAPPSSRRLTIALVAYAAAAVGLVFGLVRANLVMTPADLILGFVLLMSLSQLIWQGFMSGQGSLSLFGIGQSVIVAVAYGVAFTIFSAIQRSSTSHAVTPSSLNWYVAAFVACGFLGLFVFHVLLTCAPRSPWLRPLYVHAMNGFYIDIPARRLTAFIYGQVAPVQ